MHTDVRPRGGFSASTPILNDLQRLIVWGITSNLHGIPTDCNQRDERMGWMADAHLYAEPALWNFDMAAFYTNFLRDIHDGQTADGTVTDTVPFKWRRRPADPAWGAAYPLLVWDMYLYYGDRSVVEQHYEGVKAWTDFLKSRAEDGILRYSYYGDWVAIDETPGELVSTFFYYYSARLVSRMAGVLGRTADAEAYAELASQIRDAFNRRFYSPERLAFGTGTQTAQVLALYLNLAAKEHRGRAWRRLYNDIVYGHNTHLTTGIIGTKYLMEVLDAQNRNDLAYELVKQTTYPSWGYMIEHGATTLWELWQDRSGPTMNSHNHPMFGSVGAWLYEALAGIHPDADHPGFERIRIAPHPVRDLRWASAEIDTLRGPVASSWRRTESSLRLEVTIPVGSEAEVVLPKLGMADVEVSESGRPAWKDNQYQSGVPGLAGAQQTRREIVFQAGSGHYIFDLRGAASE